MPPSTMLAAVLQHEDIAQAEEEVIAAPNRDGSRCCDKIAR